jgi:hypothetical protein
MPVQMMSPQLSRKLVPNTWKLDDSDPMRQSPVTVFFRNDAGETLNETVGIFAAMEPALGGALVLTLGPDYTLFITEALMDENFGFEDPENGGVGWWVSVSNTNPIEWLTEPDSTATL